MNGVGTCKCSPKSRGGVPELAFSYWAMGAVALHLIDPLDLALEGGVGVWGDFHIVEAKET
jgi:hypothetical protein